MISKELFPRSYQTKSQVFLPALSLSLRLVAEKTLREKKKNRKIFEASILKILNQKRRERSNIWFTKITMATQPNRWVSGSPGPKAKLKCLRN